jgi:hypothetical protein
VFGHAGGAEVIALTAHCNDERVVPERTLRRHLAAGLLVRRGNMHQPPRAVESDHLADPVAKRVPVSLRQVVEFVGAKVHAASGDLVQLGLPDVRSVAVDEGHVDAATHLVAETRRELESTGAAAHDDDTVSSGLRIAARPSAHWSRSGRVSFSAENSAVPLLTIR